MSEALSRGFDRGFMVGAVVKLVSAVVAVIGLRTNGGRHVPVSAKAVPEVVPE